jgi:hypothetical protein
MAIYNGQKSRAPLVPLNDVSKSVDGELIVDTSGKNPKLLVNVTNDSGEQETVNLVETITDEIAQNIKDTKQFKVDPDEPTKSQEQIWFKVETFENDTETMKAVSDYAEDEFIDQL